MVDTLVFAVRGSLTARYSNGGPTGMAFGNTAPVAGADAGALSGQSIVWAASGNAKGVSWMGRSNTPNGRAISVLCRFRPGYTTAPAALQGIWSLTTGSGNFCNIELAHRTAGNGGDLVIQAKNELAALCFNTATFGAWAPTSGTWYDIVFTWDGNTTANGASIYVDGVLLGQATAAAAYTASWSNQYFSEINLGTGKLNGIINAGRVDEVVIWSNVIDPTAVTLESGTGALDGAARVSLVAATAFDGSTYTDPGVANVKSGTGYTYAGSSLTGTLVSTTTITGVNYGGPGPMGRN